MLRASRSARGAALALLACACGAPERAPLPHHALTVSLGTGEAEYESLDGEPQLRLVAGIQGGQHVWASFLAHGLSARQVGMLLTTYVDDAPDSKLEMRANLTTRQVLDDEGELAYTFAGFPAQVHRAPCAHGKRVRIELTLSDADGEVATDTRYCIADVEASRRSQSCP